MGQEFQTPLWVALKPSAHSWDVGAGSLWGWSHSGGGTTLGAEPLLRSPAPPPAQHSKLLGGQASRAAGEAFQLGEPFDVPHPPHPLPPRLALTSLSAMWSMILAL